MRTVAQINFGNWKGRRPACGERSWEDASHSTRHSARRRMPLPAGHFDPLPRHPLTPGSGTSSSHVGWGGFRQSKKPANNFQWTRNAFWLRNILG